MNLPSHQMSEATHSEFMLWWPLMERYVPQLVAKCTPLSEWDSARTQMTRWASRLHTMKYECAAVMNELGLFPGYFLADSSSEAADGVGHDVLHNPV